MSERKRIVHGTTTTTVGRLVIDVGTVGIVGSLFGLPVELLVLGAFAGVIATGLRPPLGRIAALAAVLLSALLAASLAPVAAHVLDEQIQLQHPLLQPALAIVIGAGWPFTAPFLWQLAKRWLQRFLGIGGQGHG